MHHRELESIDPDELLVEVGDAAELTAGQGSGGSEDKRYQYN